MDKFIKKIIAIIILAVFCMPPVFAQDLMHTTGNINHEFTLSEELPEYVYLKNANEIIAKEEIIIPKNSTLKLKTICARKERRWHKSGFILTKLENYTAENSDIPYDISEENVYLAVRKHDPVNKKEAAILATEIIVFTGASYYAPGVDIVYFFTKGAILRQKHPNWFKAGVHNAYENSIFWFWLKGKPIELKKDSQIKIQSVKEQKIEKLTLKVNKYNEKQEIKELKKQEKQLKKESSEKYQLKKAKKEEKELLKAQKRAEKESSEEYQFKKAKKEYKKYKKEIKKIAKEQKKLKNDATNSAIKKNEKRYFKALKKQVKLGKKDIKRIIKVQKHFEKRNQKQIKENLKEAEI